MKNHPAVSHTLLRRAVSCACVAFLSIASAKAVEVVWDGGAGDNDWHNPTNWVGDLLPVANDYTKQNGTVVFASGTSPNLRAIRIGKDGTGSMVISGGTLTSTAHASWDSHVGSGSGASGTVTQYWGDVTINELEIGRAGATGSYILKGGSLVISRALGNYSLYLGTDDGKSTAGDGTMTISEGSFTTRRGVYLGSAGGVGVFEVRGAGATINIGSQNTLDGEWYQNGGSTLKVRVDATTAGLSKIFIDEVGGDGGGDVTFAAGALLDVGFTGAFTNGGTYTVMEWEGTVTGAANLAFAPGVDTSVWSFNVDEVNKQLTVTAAGAPFSGSSVTVESITALREFVDDPNMTVTMTPGTYWMTGEASPLFLDLSGANSTFNMTGVHIKVDTAELAGYGNSADVNVLNINADDITVDGLTLSMEKLAYDGVDAYGNPKEFCADKRSQLVKVTGSNVTVKNCNLTTGGSYPYGYGDAFGKGARPTDGSGNTSAAWIAHSKQSGFLITGGAGNVTVDNVVLNMRSFGHGFFMQQGAHDILFKDTSVLGDTMADSDDIIAHPEYQAWGAATYKQPIPADIRISKHEGAFRTYGNSDYQSNGYNQWIENVTITNCVVERMRNAVAMGAHAGTLEVYDTEIKECEMGFGASAYGTTLFSRCKGDAVNGPLIYFQYSVDLPAVYDVELTGDTPGNGVWPIALISGANNQITLTSSAAPGVYSPGAYLNCSQKWREWRHRAAADIDELNTGNYGDATTGNNITNLTDQILVFGPNATGNTDCVSNGGVINKGSGNSYTGATLVEAPIVLQDTWTYPPNPINPPWAQYDSSSNLLTPTVPYTVFSGTLLADDSLSLGGLQSDAGTVVSAGGTLEVAGGLALQGEDILFAGDGVSGVGALYSDGAVANSTRLSSSSGVITLTGDASIGVGIAGNQLLIGPIGGTGNLTKVGPGKLTMENGANTFVGSLTVAEGEVKARGNKAKSDLTVMAGAVFSQNANVALNQGNGDTTVLDGTLDINGRGAGDNNSLSVNIGILSGSGLVTSTATGPVQTLNVNGDSADSSFSGVIESHVAVVKNGAGTTFTLSGTSTHSGPTTVNAGTLRVTGSLPAASAVTVNSGGALDGSGAVNGSVTLANGATLAPGAGVGGVNTGPQTWHGNAALEVEMSSVTGTAGSDWDLATVNGSVTLDASVTTSTPFVVKLSGPTMSFNNRAAYSWLIVDATGVAGGFSADKFSVDASAFAANNPLAGGVFAVAQSGDDLYLDFIPSNDPPAFTSDPINKPAATEDLAYSDTLAGSATDPDAGDTVTYSKVSGPAWLNVAGDGTLSGTPANGDVGANAFTVRATDPGGLFDDATLNITVNNVNDPPAFASDPFSAGDATEAVAYSDSIAGSAIDPDVGDTLSYSKTGGPAWLNIASNGALSGTPSSGDVGLNAFTVQVDDGNGGSDTATLNITVNAAVTSPDIRVTEYYLTTGDFTGTTTTITLGQDLANDYYILVRGSRTGDGSSNPNNDYARVISVPGGRGDLAASGANNLIGLQRQAADFDWEGVVTVVECQNAASAGGFKLVDAVVTSMSATSGTDTSASWTDINQVVLFGGYRGGGVEMFGNPANRKEGTGCYTRLYPSGSGTINWSRDAGGETMHDATMTTFVVEWGSEWTIQHVNVAGNNGGNGADATGEYTTAAINSVVRANTWVWGTGTRADSGIGDCAEACLVALGDGVSQNANESLVAVGSEYTDAYDFDVYVMTHPSLLVDHRFKVDGDKNGLDVAVTVDTAPTGARFGWVYNGCHGTGTAFARPRLWSRYTSDSTVTVSRGYDGQDFPAWVQGIDFSGLNP